jgi:hypothetical protein
MGWVIPFGQTTPLDSDIYAAPAIVAQPTKTTPVKVPSNNDPKARALSLKINLVAARAADVQDGKFLDYRQPSSRFSLRTAVIEAEFLGGRIGVT